MPWALTEILLALPVYALVLMRVAGLVMTAPIYASSAIPVRIRGALVLTVSAMIFPLVRGQAPSDLTLSSALVAGVSELAVGAVIGLSLSILLMGGEVAGLIVGRQASVSLAEVFDPARNVQTSIVGQIYTIVLTVLFLLAGGHRATMAALLDTYQVVPLLAFQHNESIILLLVEMLASAFMLGIRLAGPVLIALFLLGVSMGFVSRTMPQFNVLSVGFTLRVLVGLAVAALSIMACESLMLDAIHDGVEMTRAALGLVPGDTGLTG